MPASPKIAVVLFNLGGPSGPRTVRPFLFNFFMDRNIIPLPKPLRFMLACWISWQRRNGYAPLNGISPLLANTQAQAAALEKALQEKMPEARVFISMRYWHPLASETARQVAGFHPDRIILLPLYPQYSTTTTFSSFQDWQRQDLHTPTREIASYPALPGFVDAAAEQIRGALTGKQRLLFSTHGLPQRVIDRGDPYQRQVEQSARAIVDRLGIPSLDWQICYQSKVGRLPWLEPSIDTALEAAARDQVGVIVYPLSFVSEHIETLIELDVEYRERAVHLGIPSYTRVATVGTHPAFIQGLRDLVMKEAEHV